MSIKLKQVVIAIGFITIVSGCSSIPGERVLARADRLSEAPEWASFTKASFVEDNSVKFIGTHELAGDHRISSGCKIAQNKAKGEIASEISQKLNFVFQHAEEGSEIDLEQTKYIGGEASKLTASAIHYEGCYWERVAIQSGFGSYDVRYRIFAKISIPQKDLLDAIRKASRGQLSESFAKEVANHWDSLVSE